VADPAGRAPAAEPPASSGFWWRLTRLFARFAIACYYRSFRVEDRGRIPTEGPVLFVVNHPNSLVDPAAILVASPRPVHFAAKGPLFRTPVLGFIMEKLGAVPVDRPSDAGSDVRRNLGAFARMAAILRGGGACAIFPEGLSHLDPELKAVKSGPARVALEAEGDAGWGLGLRVVPVGLTFHPRQVFRGEVVVRVGEPFRVDDLKERNRHEAIREVQARIRTSLQPLVHHVDRVELAPMVESVADLYREQRKAAGDGRALPREEVLRAAQACLNHYLVADPASVEEVARRLSQVERLSGRTGVSGAAVRMHMGPVRAFASYAGLGLLLLLGFPVFLFGVLTSFVPYRATDRAATALSGPAGGPTTLPLLRVLAGIGAFGLWWGGLCWFVWDWSGSTVVTACFAVSLAVAGILSRAYWLRARSWAEGLEALLPYFARRRAVGRVAEARADLLEFVEGLVRRYEATLGAPLLPPAEKPVRRLFPWARVSAVVLAAWLAWFAAGFRGTAMESMGGAPSPWGGLPAEEARAATVRDAAILANTLDTLDGLERRMDALRADFDAGRRDFYDPAANREIRATLLSYLNCREVLFKLAWFYKAEGRPEPEQAKRARVLAHVAAVELCARGMQFVEAFDRHPDAVRKLNEQDPDSEIPPRVYDGIRRNLADSDLLDALAASVASFQSLEKSGAFAGPEWREEPWPRILARGAEGARVAERLSDRLWTYKWKGAVERARVTGDTGRYAASSVVSTWIGDARVRTRTGGAGLVSKEQVASFRARLQPGDILVERRNWYLSNAFLPGFWKHAAIYIGGVDGVRALGLEGDPVLAKVVEELGVPDHEGHRREVLEAVSEGVILSSLEESIGGADAVCAFRPRLLPEKIVKAVRTGLLQKGKPYDFDFDFFSTDKLVCTEVVYQAYQGSLHFELPEIMGRRTLPALEIVRLWDGGRGKPDAPLAFVAFLDGDEATGTAKDAGEDALRESITRPGRTLLQPAGAAGKPLLYRYAPFLSALAAACVAAFLLFRKRAAVPGL
jgi:1-acyl-sn-glycerol-3-phosphate acyltransferase